MGWSSSSLAETDFLSNGSALPMYALFAVCLVLFLLGMRRVLRGALDAARLRRAALPRGGVALSRLARHVLLQRRIFRRGFSGLVHLPIFWGFVVLAAGSLTLMVDAYLLPIIGLRLERGLGYRLFQATLDFFGLAFVAGVGLALGRRLRGRARSEPVMEGTLAVLFVLLWIGISGFALEGLRIVVEEVQQPWSFVGAGVAALFDHRSLAGDGGLTAYMVLWWCHVVSVFGLIAVLPFTPLRHVLVSPLNILISAERPSGSPQTPFLLRELIDSGKFDARVGADSITDLSPRERLALLACAGSGNCQDACPAYAAGTPLSPMQLMHALRRTAAEEGNGRRKSPLAEVVSEDAVWSCTLCGACSTCCPTLIDPSRYVVELRRGLVARNQVGAERAKVLANLTRARNPYGSDAAARETVAAELGIGANGKGEGVDLLYWLGCAATFDPRVRRVAEATVAVLERAGLRCRILGAEEACCGEPARRIGEEGLFQELALRNLAAIERHGATRIVTHCAHCFHTLRNEYAALGAKLEVVHHVELIRELLDRGAIRLASTGRSTVTLHDSCYVGRFNGDASSPRAMLRSIPGTTLLEMEPCGDRAHCCGGGGANYWYEVPHRESIASIRVRQARRTGAQVLVTECPFCLKKLGAEQASTAAGAEMIVRDIAEIVADSIERAAGDD